MVSTKLELTAASVSALFDVFLHNELGNAKFDCYMAARQEIEDEPDAFKQLEMREILAAQRKDMLQVNTDAVVYALAQCVWAHPTATNLQQFERQLAHATTYLRGVVSDGFVWAHQWSIDHLAVYPPVIIAAAIVIARAENPTGWLKLNADGAGDLLLSRLYLYNTSNSRYNKKR